jgi:ribonucleotide reductase alpha subunit
MRVPLEFTVTTSTAPIDTYNMMSNKYAIHATPKLQRWYHRAQMSSCYLPTCSKTPSTDTTPRKECALISGYAGGIGLSVSNIRANGSTSGYERSVFRVVPWPGSTPPRDTSTREETQGAVAMYLEPWHDDVEAFWIPRNGGIPKTVHAISSRSVGPRSVHASREKTGHGV